MGSYKNILTSEYKQFNKSFKMINKRDPSKSIAQKSEEALTLMTKARELYCEQICKERNYDDAQSFLESAQLITEVLALMNDLNKEVTRYYLKSDDLYEFFENTDLSEKTVQYVLSEFTGKTQSFGVLGKTKSYCLCILSKEHNGKMFHIVSVLNDKENSTFVPELLSKETRNSSKAFRLAMNFILYLKAHPEMIIDGAPADVKKSPLSKRLDISPKVVSHSTTEHGFVRPHFRCGHYRHLMSDYYKNKQGQVIFIESTVVNGKAKTVLKA